MKVKSILLVLAMLPALLAPGGSTFCLCACPEMRAPAASHPCCEQEAPERDSRGPSQAKLVAACTGCQPVSLPDVQVRQDDTSRAERLATPLPPVAFAPALTIFVPRLERSLARAGCRSPSPPGRRGALPLLI